MKSQTESDNKVQPQKAQSRTITLDEISYESDEDDRSDRVSKVKPQAKISTHKEIIVSSTLPASSMISPGNQNSADKSNASSLDHIKSKIAVQ